MSDYPELDAAELEPLLEKYGFLMQLRLEESDKTAEARKFLKAATESIARMLMQTWLANPGSYDIDIKVTMEKKS